MASADLDLAIVIPTFVGSLLSFLATSVALGLHMLHPPKRHFRHALIINLLVADFINSLNNTISGAFALAQGSKDGADSVDAACLANAWIGQFSVQAVDFNILIISVVVLNTVLNSRIVAQSSTWATVAICGAAWIPGLITSNIGLAAGSYGHVSGNWCWIRSSYLGLRYALTHGWRIAIFVVTIAIYTFIYIHLKRVFGKFRMSSPSSGTANTTSRDATFADDGADTQHILVSSTFAVSHELDEQPQHTHPGPLGSAPTGGGKATFWSVSADDSGGPAPSVQTVTKHARFRMQQPAERQPASKMPAPPNLKKMLLMNGYPIAYIILWMPGIINRLTESLGSSPRWLRALQCTTQFIGLVNAFTYSFSEHLRRTSKGWKKRRGFLRTGG